ncbi:hypothetical protein C0993_010349 [Termitomyces sp. T159_Od127]|nr:hypothetical protein C0993_010349 [Termitomyces sp. T159_Od127]
MSSPQFTVSLQRDTVEVGGNDGLLSIGELPSSVSNDSLTWVPLRRYTVDEGGLPPPPDSPKEVYPITWEVFVDDVYLDGEKLPKSSLSSGIKLSALVDTGNSLLRGPSDVVSEINRKLGNTFPCDEPHTLAFQIGGKMFPVDPRDFIVQAKENDVESCIANLVTTDPPAIGGFLFSWSLGDPFLKRMGFLSTVPSDAGDRLKADVSAAKASGDNFPSTLEQAPTGVRTSTSTSISKNNAASRIEIKPWGMLTAPVLIAFGVTLTL